MHLRLPALVYTLFNCIFLRKILLFLLLIISYEEHYCQSNTDDIKKEANKLFEEDEFTSAYKLYAQLVANFPKDPEYNFRLGVCMIYSEPDKKKCLPYLQFANSKPNDAPKEVKFYLGKAYHINYLFDEAIKYYGEYKKVGSGAKQKKLQVDREMLACNNGKRLLSNLSDLVVLSKKSLNEADYFRSYDVKDLGGKLLVKPEEFKTAPDKKKKDKSIVFLSKNTDRVYFSSYGPNTDNGRDIYFKIKLPNGTFSEPQKVKGINTEFDEDYPFLHPNGTTLYFASKGFNSMGGYDIFKTNYIAATDSWSQPENMEFPINSPDDDYLFVTDSLEKTAFFCTGRQSLPGKIDVLKINTERKPIDVLAITGTVLKENPQQSLKSKITVKNIADGKILGIYYAADNGEYAMDLPNGAALSFSVETPGLNTQSDKVTLPLVSTSKPLKQKISYDKGILKILNYFDEASTDESYVQYLKIIEQKAKLNVNEGENKVATQAAGGNPLKTGLGNTKDTSGRPTVIEDTTQKTVPVAVKTNTPASKQGVSNKQLTDIARQDASEAVKEATQFRQDADDAFEVGNMKKIEADKKIAEGDEGLKNAEAITNEEEKKLAVEKATAIKTQGETEKATATEILNLAKTLKTDADNKQIIAELNTEYVKELEKSLDPKSNAKPDAAKLDAIQKQIAEISGRKNESDDVYTSIKNKVEEKEKEIVKIEQANATVKDNLQEIKAAITTNETELPKAKKKNREPIEAKIKDLKAEQIEKEKQVAANEGEITKLKNELAGLKDGQDLANKIKTETIAVNTKTTSINDTRKDPENKGPELTSQGLSDKYKDKVAVIDNSNKTSVEESSTQLKNYNKEIDAAIAKDKGDLLKAKSPAAKQDLNNEIKKLETSKRQNTQQIAANNKLIDDINKTAANNNAAKNNLPDLNPISTNNPAEAVKKLGTLNDKLNTNDNPNYEYNGYQNAQAQTLKIEADTKINEAAAQQKKLKDLIASTKTQIQNPPATNTSTPKGNPHDDLNREADELTAKAMDYRAEAKTKEGDEKAALIAKAKEEEAKANEKHLQAAEILNNDNKSVFNTNIENVQALKKENKASETDINEANKLIEDANLAFKKAADIRQEANSLPNAGAKLGNLGNAEEIEADALDKQKQALYILKKTNPNLALKTAITSTTPGTAAGSPTVDLNPQLEVVNAAINELANTKIAAYKKLNEANKIEIDQITNNLKENEAAIDKTPALKSELIAAKNKLAKSESLKQAAETSGNNNDKVNNLTEAAKLQVEAINQLNNISKNLSAAAAKDNKAEPVNTNTVAAKNTNTVNEGNGGNDPANTNTVAAKNTNTTSENNAGNDPANTNTVAAKNTNTTSENNGGNDPANTNTVAAKNTNTANENNGGNDPANTNTVVAKNTNTASEGNAGVPTKTIDVSELAKKDTSTAQVVNYFEENKTALKNPGAGQLVKNTLAELKKITDEKKSVENEIKNPGEAKETPVQLKAKADALLTEAEELSVKAFDAKKSANEKTGPEKDTLMAKAKDLEDKSQNKKLEAVALTEQANVSNYNTNNNAIKELMDKLKTDDPNGASQLEQKNSEIAVLKNQAQQLRTEGNAQENKNARIGALMNAEETENGMLEKQNILLSELKKRYPDYVIKDAAVTNTSTPESLALKQTQLKEKEYTELTNLTNAFSLEYETSKNNIPANLNDGQRSLKQNAEELNAESKRLLIKSTQETNENEKVKLLTLAAKTANAAVDQLNKINPGSAVVNNNPGNNTARNNNPANNNARNNNPANNNARNNNLGNNAAANNARNNNPANNRGTVKVEGLEVIRGNAYSENKPIPLDAKIPDGLIIRVQIGAFKTRLPDNTFRGLNPVNAESTPSGYIRYTAGNFTKIENANAVKNDLRNLGYSDAFVVVYYNGKRITYNEALAILAKEGKTVDENASATAGIDAKANIPKANNNPANPNLNTQDAAVTVTKELEQINGLLFTVQIGVYTKQVKQQQLFNLKPIYTEKMANGLYRYTAGIYNNAEKIIADKNKVISFGVRDAFVSAYFNGKKVSFADGKAKQEDPATKMEPENPIVFPAGNVVPNNTPVNNGNTPVNPPANNNTPTVRPFTNGVSNYPAATPENGIKTGQDGVCFKVQIGAYSKQVPNDVAAKFSAIKNWPIENKQINALFIYNVGNFSGAKFAKALKDEAVRAGITDAFITVYKDGNKVGGAEAAALMNQ